MDYNSKWAIDYESLKSLVGTKPKIATEIAQPAIWQLTSPQILLVEINTESHKQTLSWCITNFVCK